MSSSKQIEQFPLPPGRSSFSKATPAEVAKDKSCRALTVWDNAEVHAVTHEIYIYWKTLLMYIHLVTGAGSEVITWGPMWDIKRGQLERFREFVDSAKKCFAVIKDDATDDDYWKYWDLLDEYQNANVEFSVLLNTHLKYIPLNIAITEELEDLKARKRERRASIQGRRSTPSPFVQLRIDTLAKIEK